MKVLHLPLNIASQISVTVRALRNIGVDACGLSLNNHLTQDNKSIRAIEIVSRKKNAILSIMQTLFWCKELLRSLHWADVVHWYFGNYTLPRGIDLGCTAFLKKVRIVEFWGSDIRISEIASADNPYRAKFYQEYSKIDSRESSLKIQKHFAKYGFECLVPGLELESYIQKDLFPTPFKIKQRLIISDFDPKYPDPAERCPLVVHSPSHKGQKGTKAVLQAINELKTMYEFNFQMIHEVDHAKALGIVRECDIMVDQLTAGDHGLASLEAMALGKPTICYIKPSILAKYPSDFPIVNANQDNLVEVLGNLLKDSRRRHQIGRLSRAYVEKYHDAHELAVDLVNIYEYLIKKNRNKRHERF